MRSRIQVGLFGIMLASALTWFNCNDGNPIVDLNDPSTFPGTYNLIELTDKTGEAFGQPNLVIRAGQSFNITITENGQTFNATVTVTGTLTLTDTRYTFSQTVRITVPGFPQQTETETDTGTYSINGSVITIDSDDEDPETFTITANGSRITIENNEFKFIFEKQ